MMAGMVDLFAQYERALIKARTKAGLAQKRVRGEKTGGKPPYGFRAVQRPSPLPPLLEPDPAEQRTIRLIFALRATLPFRKVVEHLNATGVPCRGAKWHLHSIQNILSRGPLEGAPSEDTAESK